jgi:hypothetical protein
MGAFLATRAGGHDRLVPTMGYLHAGYLLPTRQCYRCVEYQPAELRLSHEAITRSPTRRRFTLPQGVKLRSPVYVTGCYGSLTGINVLFADETEHFRGGRIR